MSGGYFYYHFRFDRDDIPRLVKALHIPRTFRCPNATAVDGEEALLIFLWRMSCACRLVAMSMLFNSSQGALSAIISVVGRHLEVIAVVYKLVRFDVRKWAKTTRGRSHSLSVREAHL